MGRATGKTATTHGLRASFKSWCEDVGVDHQVGECCLAHAKGDSAVAAYKRRRWSWKGGRTSSAATTLRPQRWWPSGRPSGGADRKEPV
jgi:hypothetical protein